MARRKWRTFEHSPGVCNRIETVLDAHACLSEPAAIKAALWDIKVKGLNGDIVFRKSGPEGKESGQSQPNVYLIEITDGKIEMKTL